MTDFRQTLKTLSAAEEFFELLGVPFDPAVVQVNRLHILKQFNVLLAKKPELESLPEAEAKPLYAALLTESYDSFLSRTAMDAKLFKVFQEQQPAFVGLDDIKPVAARG